MPHPLSLEALNLELSLTELHQLLALRVSAVHDDGVTMTMPFSAAVERVRGAGQFHGGPIAALIDIAGDFALIAQLGRGVPTMNMRIDYLRPSLGATLTARARVRRAGKSVGLVDIEVTDDQDRTVALGRAAYSTAAP